MEIMDKKILIIGAARSGIGSSNLLAMMGADVILTDKRQEEELDMLTMLSSSVRKRFGKYPPLNGTDLIIVSPGVPLDIELLKEARQRGIEIIGELELAYRLIRGRKEFGLSGAEFIAITGTNGKSTTTTLVDLMLKEGGFKTILGGNIGKALTQEIQDAIKNQSSGINYIVTEVSSFQLESIKDFRPRMATILNITPDHLDRYHSMGEYIDAKAAVFLKQGRDDFLVLNRDDELVMSLYESRLSSKGDSPSVFFFSRSREVKGLYYKGGKIFCNIPQLPPQELINVEEIKIKGLHNLENAMAAAALALLAGCSTEKVRNVLREFNGLEHRLEFVRELKGVRFVNDSKGTNIGATVKSLEGFTVPVILIAGGRDKASDFTLLRPLVKEKVKSLILIGEAKEKIRKALGDLAETVMASSLKEAVELARERAERGDVVLLSPACASFDMFRDFEDRGRQFKEIVWGLEE